MVVMVCTTYEYTEMHRIVYFKRLNFIVYIVFKKPSLTAPGLQEAHVGVTSVFPFCRLLIDMVPRVRQTRHYEMFE